jgi:hypothetical protein
MACPPSARIEALLPDKDTVYSREGTIAHSVAEFILRRYRDRRLLPASDIWLEQQAWGEEEWINLASEATLQGFDFKEIVETVHENYVKVVMEDYLTAQVQFSDTQLFVEAPLKLGAFIPEGFGSSDAVIIYNQTLQVYDLKYGKGVRVSAKDNPQMRCYALGALCGPAELMDISTVIMTIVQPRLQHVSSEALTADQLYLWGVNVLKPAAEKAWEGKGEPVPGEHCHFCKAAAQCRALRDLAVDTAATGRKPELMSPEELSDCLTKLPVIKDWVSALEEHALAKAMNGETIPGWKVVAGRSIRKISDPDAAEDVLIKAGFGPEDYFKPSELKGISDLEKLMGKKSFATLLGPYVVKPQGKPALAPIDDPRPEYSQAEADFNNV